ncbi:aspartate carbamoyltransferase catalytic subunit [Spiroplasma turonicum]|uniref:Aspartate carbamoyltransferase n=1 Tax=Spiroplasma turonicum TaxID=216946 RepID=A0A0K1P6U5_9MOLU|nr:aspartate carbamoyltransferase catalytic subunit [Spiroplasma turonicum]AKU80018.1 aspartate carbamoyltransferase [Spiroplasma turonicum]ALX71020.1 aspartate carbamoyltransferase catalytic subunit [Spiroplasma turonicum]
MKKIENLLTIEELSNEQINHLIEKSIYFKNNKTIIPKLKKDIFIANLFFENSTRTHKSFEVAEKMLGFKSIEFQTETSSIQKGETLYDTVLTLGSINISGLVIRHPDKEYYKELLQSKNIKSKIINAGDGVGEHPTQSLLDLMTIYENFKTFKEIKVAICGDLKHSRVAHSNMKILKRLGAKVYFAGPKEWFENNYNDYGEYKTIDEIINKVDVLMLLRVQNERHTDRLNNSINYLEEFGLNISRYNRLKEGSIIMHPCPVNRNVEIESSLIESEKSKLLEQMTNGLYMRIAILYELFKDEF